MKIYNQDKTQELTSPDLTKGYLVADKRLLRHVPAVEGKCHKEIAATYSNGGKDIITVWDVEPAAAYDEYEDIQVYVPYTDDELQERTRRNKIGSLKTELEKIKEDIEQETFGLVRDDYAAKKQRAAEIVNELRVLEGKAPRDTVGTDKEVI